MWLIAKLFIYMQLYPAVCLFFFKLSVILDGTYCITFSACLTLIVWNEVQPKMFL